MLIQGLEKLVIISPFGERDRFDKKTGKTIHELHPGIDIRVYNKATDPDATTIFPVIAPERIRITEVKFDPKWGHYIKAAPLEENELGIIEFRFWHIVPDFGCVVDAEFDPDVILGKPEAGFVLLHLHFETRIDYRGTTPIDPMKYLKMKGQEIG